MTAAMLREAGPGGGHQQVGPGRFRVQIMSAGPGTSGFYPEETLQDAARRRVFHEGLHLYINHQGYTEEADRERVGRRVEDLAGRLVTDAQYVDGALVAEAQVFAHWRPVVEETADAIGMSIRAVGQRDEQGNVTSIDEAESIDFVTKAGARGRILELIESARDRSPATVTVEMSEALDRLQEARNVGGWFESRIHLSFTERADDMFGNGHLTRDERIALSSAIGAALDAFRSTVEQQSPELYERDIYDDPSPNPTTIRTTEASKEDPVTTQTNNPDLEARIAQLEESLSTLQSERDEAVAERDAVRAERDELAEARRAADDEAAIADAVGAVDIPDALSHLAESIRARAVREIDGVPRDSDGNVRTDQLTEAATAAVEAEVEYASTVAGERIVGLGEAAQNGNSAPKGAEDLVEANDKRARSVFGVGATN